MAPALVVASLLLLAPAAFAHGPTVRVGYSGVRPPSVAVEVGGTVHFHNEGATQVQVVGDDGSFTSPALAGSTGWHHTFEQAGVFPYRVDPSNSATGKIIVYEPE